MADHAERKAQSEAEIERDAATLPEDEITSREALEEDLMDEGRSAEGKYID